MPTNYISRKLKTIITKRFRDAFSYDVPKKVGYVFIGKSTEYPDENVVSQIVDSVQDEKTAWDTMIAGKKVVPGDVEFVIPVIRWTANTRYKQYDDTLDLDFLLSETQDGDDTVYPMYVLNSENNVYKCLCNNVNQFSMVEPTGNYTESEGFIQTEFGAESCYLWKYMFNIRESNKFFTEDWMPVPFVGNGVQSSDYDLNDENIVDGSLNKILVLNQGTGYYHSSVNVSSFTSNTSILQISDNINLETSNIKVNMEVSGNGVLQGTYITNIFTSNNRIVLSSPTFATGGGANNTLNVTTRIAVTGDGSELIAQARLSGNGNIEKIDVISYGINYSTANVVIYGSGNGATARAILPPKFGHGYNPAMELGASNVMIIQRIGEVDASENSLIPTDTSFRQYGLVVNPYKYDGNVQLQEANANSVISQTTDISLIAGDDFTQGEYVYQGPESNPNFSGYVVSSSSNTVRLTQVYGTIIVGNILVGQTSGRVRNTLGIKYPDLKPYAGDILYAQNILKVERSPGQAEEIKLVFKF